MVSGYVGNRSIRSTQLVFYSGRGTSMPIRGEWDSCVTLTSVEVPIAEAGLRTMTASCDRTTWRFEGTASALPTSIIMRDIQD